MVSALTKVTELYLSEGGALTRSTGTGGPDRYTAVPGSGQARGHRLYPNTLPEWTAPAPAQQGLNLAYTTGSLDKEMTVLGSGSLDLWLESAQPDTDVQVVLTELRPDGNEVYVQAGWLRASHRTEDPQQSTPTRPYHTHRETDEVPLTPGTPELLRVEIPPFGHVFRAESALRIWIEAPAAWFGVRSLEPLPYSSDNAVHHDAQRPSVLRLSTLPGERSQADYPECVHVKMTSWIAGRSASAAAQLPLPAGPARVVAPAAAIRPRRFPPSRRSGHTTSGRQRDDEYRRDRCSAVVSPGGSARCAKCPNGALV